MDFTQDPGTRKSFTGFLNLLDISSAKFSRTNLQNSTLHNNDATSENNKRSWKLPREQDPHSDIELSDLIDLVYSTLQELKEISDSYIPKTLLHPENSIAAILHDKDYVTNSLLRKNSMENLMSSIYTDDCQTMPTYSDRRSIRESKNNYSKDSGYVDGEEEFDLVNNIMKSSIMLDSSPYFNRDRTIPEDIWKVGDIVNEINRSYPLEGDENYVEPKTNDNLSKSYDTRCSASPWDSKFAKSFSPIDIQNNSNGFTNQDRAFSASPVRCKNMEEAGETIIPTHDKNEMNNLLRESIMVNDGGNKNLEEITEQDILMDGINESVNSERIQQQSCLNCLNNLIRKDTNILGEDKQLNFNQTSSKSISDTGYITDEEIGPKIAQLELSNGFNASKICNVDQKISPRMANEENLFKNKRETQATTNIRNRKNFIKGNRKISPKRTKISDMKNKNFKHDAVHDASRQTKEMLPHKCNEKLSSRYSDKVSPRSGKTKNTIRNCKFIETHVKPLSNLKGNTNSINNSKLARTKVSTMSQDSNKVSKDNNRIKMTESRVESIQNISQEDKRIAEESSGVIKKCINTWEKVNKPSNIKKTSQGSKLTKRQGNLETRSKIPVGKSCGDIQNSVTPCKRFQTPESVHKISSINSEKKSVIIRSLGEQPFSPSDIAASQDLLSRDNRNLIELEENRVTRICQCLAETKAQQRHKSSSSKELSIVPESQVLSDQNFNQSVIPSKRCESAIFGNSGETNANRQKSNSKTRRGTPKRFSTTKVGQSSLQNVNERLEKPKVIKMLEEIINNTSGVLEENDLSNNINRTTPRSIKLSISSLQNNDLSSKLNSNYTINSCIKSSSVTCSRPHNEKVHSEVLYNTDMNDSDTLPIKLSTKYINVASNAQFSESQTDTDMEELFKNQSKKSVGLQKETDYSSGTDGQEYTIDSKTVTDIDYSRSNVQFSLTDVPWGSEFTSDYSTNVSTYAKDCQTSLPSLLSSSKTLEIGILEEYATGGTMPKQTCANSQGSLNNGRNELSDNCTKSEQSLKKQFLNKHAKSLHVLKEILKCEELSVDFLNAAERELKIELRDKAHENSKIESRSQNLLNTNTSDCMDLRKKRNSNKFIGSQKSLEDLQPERLDRDTSIAFSNGVEIKNCSCSPSCEMNNCFERNETMSKGPCNLVALIEPVSLVNTKSRETSCKLRTVTEEEEVSCKPEDFSFLKKEITTQAPFTREVFTESEFCQTIFTQTGQASSLKDVAISSEDYQELIIKETKSTSCDAIPNQQTVGIECMEQLNILYNSKTINTDQVIASQNEVTIFKKSNSKNASVQVEEVPEPKKLATDTFTETLKSCYNSDVAKDIIEEVQSNNTDRSYEKLVLKCNDTLSASTVAYNECTEELSTFTNDYLNKKSSEDMFVEFKLISNQNQNLGEEIYKKKFGKSTQNVYRKNSFIHLVQAISITSFGIQETKLEKVEYNRLEKPIELFSNLKTVAAPSDDTSIKLITNTSTQLTNNETLPKIKVFINFLLNHLRCNFQTGKSSQNNESGDDSTIEKGLRKSKRDQKALWNKDNKIESLKSKRIKHYGYSNCSLFSRQQLFACIYAVLCSIVFCSFQFSHFCES